MKTRFSTTVIALITLLGCGGLLALFVPPALQAIAEITTEQIALAQTVADLEQRHTPLKNLVAHRDANQVLADKLAALLPQDKDIDQLVLHLDTTSRAHALTPATITIADSATAKKAPTSNLPAGVSEIKFSLEIAGSYGNIRTFLGALEGGDRLIEIRDVRLVHGSDSYIHAHVEGRAFMKAKPTLQLSTKALTITDETRAKFQGKVGAPNLPAQTTGRLDPFGEIN